MGAPVEGGVNAGGVAGGWGDHERMVMEVSVLMMICRWMVVAVVKGR